MWRIKASNPTMYDTLIAIIKQDSPVMYYNEDKKHAVINVNTLTQELMRKLQIAGAVITPETVYPCNTHPPGKYQP